MKGRAQLDATFFPDEARAQILKAHEEQIAEEWRIASLTPEQRQEEVEALLKELRKGSGFIELTIPRR